MRDSFKTLAFISLLLLVVLSGVVSSQTITPGVSQGDSFTYSFSVHWSSPDPNAVAPAELLSLNETELIRVVVTNTGGSVVFLNVTRQYKNGTMIHSPVFVNLLDGSGDGFGLVIAPNLGPRYYAYPMGWNQSTSFLINEALNKTYPFGERNVLHATVNRTDSPDYVYIFYDMYFDRETGVMLEYYVERVPYEHPDEKTVLLWKIKEFYVKSPAPSNGTPEPGDQTQGLPPGLLALAIIMVIVCTLVFLRVFTVKRKKHKRPTNVKPTN